ncbi:baseplate J/gp47 family protein [Pseudoalteromonas sp. MMG013]|uniref:baseplate J/gp47 family protein n=1 Tax=Pseudoalteromonas sp. MMG013 TaxID=2822687 RepID=UPI001B382CE8|nr:baseplate J/gp47 family protein [Pseudoalteromonas sp. MMG013]MBQ4864602.1 baseplate J/gp47 family protein [Pseudoalteromonas sp. MMG013]
MAKLIDLSKVPVPDIVEQLNFEQLYEKNKQLLIELEPSYAQALQFDSDPQAKQLQILTYREMHLIAKINKATKANILASAFDKDLEAFASNYNIERLVITPENPATNPITPAVMESDDALKRRAQLAFDGLNTAGSVDGYIFHTLGVDGHVLDADAYSPAPCEIVVIVLAHTETGLPTNDLLIKIRNHFGLTNDGTAQLKTPSKIRPQGDRVTIQSADIINYSVEAELNIMPGPDKQVVLAATQQALVDYQFEQRKLGASITLSGIYKALHQPGVNDVNIIQPVNSVKVEAYQSAYCTNINIKVGP